MKKTGHSSLFTGFSKEGLDFLDQIKENNNKVWFENHRHIWEETILKPNVAYVEEMGEHLIALAPFIKALPKVSGSLFRIYKDTRFSHDKTHIKTKIGILFWQGSSHRMQ
ncbi:MAG: TIGR02453 family protein, partial [Deltaproteobacteria bacterium HGW-Deltaproteobacteria-24]